MATRQKIILFGFLSIVLVGALATVITLLLIKSSNEDDPVEKNEHNW